MAGAYFSLAFIVSECGECGSGARRKKCRSPLGAPCCTRLAVKGSRPLSSARRHHSSQQRPPDQHLVLTRSLSSAEAVCFHEHF